MTRPEDYDPASHYDRVTEAWLLLLGDELHYGVFRAGDEPLPTATAALTRTMIDAARLEVTAPGAQPLRLLDIGCGSGAPACDLVEELGIEVVGITTSPVGVATARDRAARRGLPGATFEQRDGTDNGFDDASFDVAWAMESAHLMRDRQGLLSEAARVVRPGGRVVLCDLLRWREIPFAEVRERRDDFATLRTAFGDAHFESLAYYADSLTALGLKVEVAEDLTRATLPTFDRWRANAAEHRDAVVDLIGVDGLTAFERSCDILEAFWQDGTFGYGVVAARRPA